MNTNQAKRQHFLAIDVGTSVVKVGIIDRKGSLLRVVRSSLDLVEKPGGIYEQDANVIAREIDSLISSIDLGAFDIGQAGLAVQRSSVLAWNTEQLRAVSPCISWMDTREREFVRSLSEYSDEVKSISGLLLSPHYSASKLQFLKQLQGGDVVVSPLVSFLISCLVGSRQFICEESIAARTQLYDVSGRQWSDRLLEIFEVQDLELPEVCPSQASYGFLRKAKGVELSSVCGDQSAAYYGQDVSVATGAVLNLGTGGFLLKEVGGSPLKTEVFLNTVLSSTADSVSYALEGTINGVGSALQLPTSSKSSPGEVFLNAVGGLGSPFWASEVDYRFENLDSKPLKFGHLDSVLDSIAYLVYYNLQHMKSYLEIDHLYFSGGLTSNQKLLERICFDGEVYLSEVAESTLLGTAVLAGFCSAVGNASSVECRVSGTQDNIRKRNHLYFRLKELATKKICHDEAVGPLLIAHRGDCEEVENTLESVALALKNGAECIEVDLQLSKDEQFVLFHDRNMERLLGRSDKVSDFTVAELKSFTYSDRADRKISTFCEVKACLNRANAKMNTPLLLFPELKRVSIEHFGVEKAVELFADGLIGLECDYYVTSFSLEALKLLKKRYRVKTALVLEGLGAEELRKQEALQSEVVAINAKYIDRKLKHLPESGGLWMVYDAETKAEFERFHEIGAKFIETKHFGGLKTLLECG